MKAHWMFALGVTAGVVAVMTPRHLMPFNNAYSPIRLSVSAVALAHTEEKFEFVAKGPMKAVGPLFGAERERDWAPEWNPEFVFPTPAADVRGMVFTVKHGDLNATWVNTAFDLNVGRVQYAYVIPEKMVTLITIQLTPQGSSTHVAVEYERTALSADANEHVRHLAENDGKAGPEWEKQINEALEKVK
jgi:hypothetical protein